MPYGNQDKVRTELGRLNFGARKGETWKLNVPGLSRRKPNPQQWRSAEYVARRHPRPSAAEGIRRYRVVRSSRLPSFVRFLRLTALYERGVNLRAGAPLP